ncbi:MAG: hypothetical protein FJX72_02570 [Armatimonadetes bacterium]|nr:hypothetical protein [Armatimonadota bacterium]
MTRGRRWARSCRVWSLAALLSAATLASIPTQSPEPAQWAFVASPNVDARPPGAQVTCVVMHATEIESLIATIGCFRARATKVSAHFVVDKDGMVVQMVPVTRRAWHAGRSALEGVAHVNDFSVGIEMINRGDGHDPYPGSQIEAAAQIVRSLRRRYAIPDRRVVSHAHVARPMGRKVDPLGFNMRAFREQCRAPARP